MQNLGLEPSCHTYDGLIKAIVSDRGFSDGMEVVRSTSVEIDNHIQELFYPLAAKTVSWPYFNRLPSQLSF